MEMLSKSILFGQRVLGNSLKKSQQSLDRKDNVITRQCK